MLLCSLLLTPFCVPQALLAALEPAAECRACDRMAWKSTDRKGRNLIPICTRPCSRFQTPIRSLALLAQ